MSVEILFWYWWVVAVVLLGLEMLSAGFFFLWMAISAFITGLLMVVIPFGIEAQLLIFAVLSMSSVFIWKRYMQQHPVETDHPHLNKRGSQYIGRTFTLIEAIENGQGKVKVDDSRWKVEGDDCPVGSKVKVIDVEGTIFKVEVLAKAES